MRAEQALYLLLHVVGAISGLPSVGAKVAAEGAVASDTASIPAGDPSMQQEPLMADQWRLKSENNPNSVIRVYDGVGIFSGSVQEPDPVANVLEENYCDGESKRYEAAEKGKVMLIRSPETMPVEVVHCRVTVTVTKYKCPHGLLTRGKVDGRKDTPVEIPIGTCQMLRLGRSQRIHIRGFGNNSMPITAGMGTTDEIHEHYSTGTARKDGSCVGDKGVYDGEADDDIVVKIKAKVSMGYKIGKYSTTNGEVTVEDGVRIVPSSNTGIIHDKRGTYTLAREEDIPTSDCEKWYTLVEGEGTLHSPTGNRTDLQKVLDIKRLLGNNIPLFQGEEMDICKQKAYKTLDPKLAILYLTNNDGSAIHHDFKRDPSLTDADLERLINGISHAASVKKSPTGDVSYEAVKELCMARQQTLHNYMNLASKYSGKANPTLGLQLEGMDFDDLGAARLLIRGLAINATVRNNVEGCCEELPVSFNDSRGRIHNLYADARTGFIRETCTPRECQPINGYYYRVRILNRETGKEEIQWLCNYASNEIGDCDKAPGNLEEVMALNESEYAARMMQNQRRKLNFYPEDMLKQHYKAVMFSQAVKSWTATSAKKWLERRGMSGNEAEQMDGPKEPHNLVEQLKSMLRGELHQGLKKIRDQIKGANCTAGAMLNWCAEKFECKLENGTNQRESDLGEQLEEMVITIIVAAVVMVVSAMLIMCQSCMPTRAVKRREEPEETLPRAASQGDLLHDRFTGKK